MVELATATVLLVGAGLLGQSLYRLLRVHLGFEPDHLATMLGAYAALCASEEAAGNARARGHFRGARRAFLWEHLLSWLPVYLDKLMRVASAFYKAWAGLLREALDAEALALGEQDALPLHLREARDVERCR